MPPRRVGRANGHSYLTAGQAPQPVPESVVRLGDEESVGQTEDSVGHAANNNADHGLNSPELMEDDAMSSTHERVNTPEPFKRVNTQDPIERMCERMINKMDQMGQVREREPAGPTFLNIVSMMRTLGIEKYPGGTDPFDAELWLKNLERNFSATRCPEEYKRDVAVYYLDRDATNWWETMEDRFRHHSPDYAWVRFKEEFLRKYFPVEARDRLENQYMQLVQGISRRFENTRQSSQDSDDIPGLEQMTRN